MDLFHQLLHEAEADDITVPQHIHLPLTFLAAFALRHCSFSFDLPGGCQETQEAYIAERIAEELSMIQAYLSVWRSSGTVPATQQQHVDSKLSKHLQEVVHPWPEISATPTPEHSDGRFAKAFPLTFPTGHCDLY